jgi:hypothetical protein
LSRLAVKWDTKAIILPYKYLDLQRSIEICSKTSSTYSVVGKEINESNANLLSPKYSLEKWISNPSPASE